MDAYGELFNVKRYSTENYMKQKKATHSHICKDLSVETQISSHMRQKYKMRHIKKILIR